MLKYYQNELNNINTMSKTNNIILISFIIILGLYIINFLLKKNNIETFTEATLPVSLYDNDNILFQSISIPYDDTTPPVRTIIFNDYYQFNHTKIRISTQSDYNILAVYNHPSEYHQEEGLYFYLTSSSTIDSQKWIPYIISNKNIYLVSKLLGFFMYKNFIINYDSLTMSNPHEKLIYSPDRPAIINTVVNITYRISNNNSLSAGGIEVDIQDTEPKGEGLYTIGYIIIKQNNLKIGKIIYFKTGYYKLNPPSNSRGYIDGYNHLLNLVDSTGKNIANYIVKNLVNPTDIDVITIYMPNGYHVYAYYGGNNKICYKTSKSSYVSVNIFYKIDGEILTNIIISKTNYSMVFSNTLMITNSGLKTSNVKSNNFTKIYN